MASAPFPPRGCPPRVVLEDPEFLVVEKPAGMHTAPGARGAVDPRGEDADPGDLRSPSLAEWVFLRYPEILAVEGWNRGEGGLIHRLDRETSGLVLFARTSRSFRTLARSADEGLFRKEYALRARPSGGTLPGSRPGRTAPRGVDPEGWRSLSDTPFAPGQDPGPLRESDRAKSLCSLLSDALHAGRPVDVSGVFRPYGPGAARVACADPEADLGKARKLWGSTVYRTDFLAASAAGETLELRVALTRGFRHQIRAHLAWIGLPLDGDEVYGGARGDRLALHAGVLEFPDPRNGAMVRIEA